MTDRLTGFRTHRDGLLREIDAHRFPCRLVDLDRLIWMNDRNGLDAGDRVPAAVAERLARSLVDDPSAVFRSGRESLL